MQDLTNKQEYVHNVIVDTISQDQDHNHHKLRHNRLILIFNFNIAYLVELQIALIAQVKINVPVVWQDTSGREAKQEVYVNNVDLIVVFVLVKCNAHHVCQDIN